MKSDVSFEDGSEWGGRSVRFKALRRLVVVDAIRFRGALLRCHIAFGRRRRRRRIAARVVRTFPPLVSTRPGRVQRVDRRSTVSCKLLLLLLASVIFSGSGDGFQRAAAAHGATALAQGGGLPFRALCGAHAHQSSTHASLPFTFLLFASWVAIAVWGRPLIGRPFVCDRNCGVCGMMHFKAGLGAYLWISMPMLETAVCLLT